MACGGRRRRRPGIGIGGRQRAATARVFGRATHKFITGNVQLHTICQLPGVFVAHPGNPSLSSVNGSWWTIPVEAQCYVYLAILGALGLRHRWLSLLALAVVALMYAKTLPEDSHADALGNLSYFYIAFSMTGLCSRQYAGLLHRMRLPLVGMATLCVVAAFPLHQPRLAEWVLVASLTLLAEVRSTPVLRSAGRFGDFSYGIYLYAYFAQQLTVELWSGTPGFVSTLVVAALATAVLAWCSWRAVEAPALKLKRRLRSWFPDFAA